MDFDPSTEQHIQFDTAYDLTWSSGIKARFRWAHAATTVNFDVMWRLQALAVSNDEGIGVSFSNGQTVVDTGGTTDNLYISDYTNTITIENSPSTGDQIFFRISRVAGDASDTLAINASLIAVDIVPA